jgi:hypothetical protein
MPPARRLLNATAAQHEKASAIAITSGAESFAFNFNTISQNVVSVSRGMLPLFSSSSQLLQLKDITVAALNIEP